jgi:hypothetical protein
VEWLLANPRVPASGLAEIRLIVSPKWTLGPVSDTAEQIKWWDALDVLLGSWRKVKIAKGLQMARECRHPDAQWLASLFPAHGDVPTQHDMTVVMLQQGPDPRDMHLAAKLRNLDSVALLRHAAARGYAPSQALYRLSFCFREGRGCVKNLGRAVKLLRESALLEFPPARVHYGSTFGELDWERYLWHGKAAKHGYNYPFRMALLRLLPLFEKRENGRVLFTVGPLIKANLSVAKCRVFGERFEVDWMEKFQRVTALYGTMIGRARAAIACWSSVGRRCGVVKDIRVVIAKMAWGEVWRWGEVDAEKRAERARRG